MMESLVSLSILALFVGVVFPFSLEVLAVREQVKEDVELSRFLYESALFVDLEESGAKTFTSGNIQARSIETRRNIEIYCEEEKVKEITFLSTQWE